MTAETFNVVSTIIYALSAIVALGMFGIAINQLKKLRSQVEEAVTANRINGLQTFLEIEKQISDSRRDFSKAAMEMQDKKNEDGTIPESVQLYFSECLENHLNTLDRLCFCILKKYFDNDEMKIEYRHVIQQAVDSNPDRFTSSTKHRNITKIYDKWADS